MYLFWASEKLGSLFFFFFFGSELAEQRNRWGRVSIHCLKAEKNHVTLALSLKSH